MRPSTRLALSILAGVALVLAVAATRAVWLGGRALDRGDTAAARGDRAAAIAEWRTAARWYVPGVGASEPALARLERMAKDAEAAADPATALTAWQAIRTSIRSVQGLTSPFRDRLARADERIAALLAAQPNQAVAARPEGERIAWHRAVLEGAPRTSRAMLVLAALGLATWLAGGLDLVRRGVRTDPPANALGARRRGAGAYHHSWHGALVRGHAVRAAVTIAAGAALWLAAIALA